jgi:tetratricopeptide (TPR) repeat protein
MYQEAAKVSGQIGDQNAAARALGNLASVEYEQGHVVEALRLDEEALGIRRTLGDRRSIAFSLSNMGETAADLGRLDRAEKMYAEARDIAMQLGDKGELSYALSGLALVAGRRDDLESAHSLLEEAMRLRREIGESDGELEARVALAAVLVEEGDRQRAGQLANGLPSSTTPETLALGAVVRARLALEEKRIADARKEIAVARAAVKSDTGLSTGVTLDLADARVLAAEGRTMAAVNLARDVRERMRSRQLEAFELEAALAVAEIGRDRAAAKALSSRATRVGFLLIARKAARAAV